MLADEVSAIVLDVGSYTVKAGYAGEDTPKAVYPSVRYQLPSGRASTRRPLTSSISLRFLAADGRAYLSSVRRKCILD